MSPTSDEKPIPIVEEQLLVSRQTDELAAIRVRVQTSSRTETFDAPVVHRGVDIERVPRNVAVAEELAPWHDGDVLVVPVYREMMVKQIILVEEIRMTPTTEVRHQTVSVDLKSDSPVIERREPGGDWQEVLPADSVPSAR